MEQYKIVGNRVITLLQETDKIKEEQGAIWWESLSEEEVDWLWNEEYQKRLMYEQSIAEQYV